MSCDSFRINSLGSKEFCNSQVIIIQQQHCFNVEKNRVIDVLDEVIELKKGTVTSNTLEWYKSIAKHINYLIGDRYINDLKPKDIQLFLNTLSLNGDKRAGERLVKSVKTLLGTTLKYSLQNDYIYKNPMTDFIKMPVTIKSNPHDKFLDYIQISQLLNIVRGSFRYSTIVKLLLMSGLRIGEALALYWEDIDSKNKVIHIRRACVAECCIVDGKKKKKYVIGITKTQGSIRDVPVDGEVINLLKDWRETTLNNTKLMDKIYRNKTENLVFTNKDGKLINYDSFQNLFQLYINRNGGKDLHVTFHMLRHSYGSFLLEQGVELITVSRLLGHKNIGITADIYCTVMAKLKINAANVTSGIWEKII